MRDAISGVGRTILEALSLPRQSASPAGLMQWIGDGRTTHDGIQANGLRRRFHHDASRGEAEER